MKSLIVSLSLLGAVSAVAIGALGGCSLKSSGDGDTPVAQKPLEGKIGGKAFSGKVAIATKSADRYSVSIYSGDRKCTDTSTSSTDGYVLFSSADWKDGVSYGLILDLTGGKSNTVTLVTPPSTNTICSDGRVEIVTVGSKEAAGTLRVRAVSNSDNTVEGEVPLYTCD